MIARRFLLFVPLVLFLLFAAPAESGEADPGWRNLVVTFLNPTRYELVAVAYGVEMDYGTGHGWERANALPWRAADIMLNHVLGLSSLELDLGTVRVSFDDLAAIADRDNPVLMLRDEGGVFSLYLVEPESEDEVILAGKVEHLLNESVRKPVEFADLVRAETIADLRRLAVDAVDEDELGMLTLNARLDGDSWAGVVVPAVEALMDYDPEETGLGELSLRTIHTRDRLQHAVDAVTAMGYRPWLLIRFETDDPYEDMEAAGLTDFTELPGGPDAAKEALLAGLTLDRSSERIVEAQAMLLSPDLYAEAVAAKSVSPGPGFTLRVGTSNLLELTYLPNCIGTAELIQGGILH